MEHSTYTSPPGPRPDLQTNNQTFEPGYGPELGFDGNLTTVCLPPDVAGWTIFRPDTAIANVTSLLVESQGLGDIWINGSSVALPAPGTYGRTYDLTSILGGGIDLESLAVTASSGQYGWYAITVNGNILVDGKNTAFGDNGFYLTFEDPSNIGKDYSGNGNDFTATGFELANQSSPTDYDLMTETRRQRTRRR